MELQTTKKGPETLQNLVTSILHKKELLHAKDMELAEKQKELQLQLEALTAHIQEQQELIELLQEEINDLRA